MNNEEREIQLKITEDGSHTLYLPGMQENYHSWHGAHTESLYVFIAQGMDKALETFPDLNILEVGMGTGLNVILTLQHQMAGKARSVRYTAVEKYPLPEPIIRQLNYESRLPEEVAPYFSTLHALPWNTPAELAPGFELNKIHGGIQEFHANQDMHLIYFDAFAPAKQPDIWTPEVIGQVAQCLVPGGILVTYCAQGDFKRNLKAAGMVVETLPGPPGKREMTRAIKPA